MTGKVHGNLRSDVPARRSGRPAHQAQPEARKAHVGRVLRSMPIAGLSGAAARTQVIQLQRAVGNRAVQSFITPSAVSVQRKPSASGVKQALGLGKKKKKKKSPAQKAEKLAHKASTAKVATAADLDKQIATLESIGRITSPLVDRDAAPKQGAEGSPEAWLVLDQRVWEGLRDLRVDDEILVLTWLDRARRDVLVVHPRDDPAKPQRGVFATRSADRPNPIGLHRVGIVAIEGARLRVRDLEAIDGTPILDIKPVLDATRDR